MEDKNDEAFPPWTQMFPEERADHILVAHEPAAVWMPCLDTENETVLLERRKNGELVPIENVSQKPMRGKRKHVASNPCAPESFVRPPIAETFSVPQPHVTFVAPMPPEEKHNDAPMALSYLRLLPNLRSLCGDMETLDRRQMLVFLDDDGEYRAFSRLVAIPVAGGTPSLQQFRDAERLHGWRATDLIQDVYYCAFTVQGTVSVLRFHSLLTRNATLAHHLVQLTHWVQKQ